MASLTGGGLIESVLNRPDYFTHILENKIFVVTGVYLELINGAAVVGIAIILFPIIKRFNEGIAIGYISFRIIESVCCLLAAIIPLTIIAISQDYQKSIIPEISWHHTLVNSFYAVRTHIAGLLIPVFFSLGAILFYFILYQSKLLPRFISVWGMAGVILILILNLFKIVTPAGMLLALPIILNEIFLGIWLIVKGFNPSVMEA